MRVHGRPLTGRSCMGPHSPGGRSDTRRTHETTRRSSSGVKRPRCFLPCSRMNIWRQSSGRRCIRPAILLKLWPCRCTYIYSAVHEYGLQWWAWLHVYGCSITPPVAAAVPPHVQWRSHSCLRPPSLPRVCWWSATTTIRKGRGRERCDDGCSYGGRVCMYRSMQMMIVERDECQLNIALH